MARQDWKKKMPWRDQQAQHCPALGRQQAEGLGVQALQAGPKTKTQHLGSPACHFQGSLLPAISSGDRGGASGWSQTCQVASLAQAAPISNNISQLHTARCISNPFASIIYERPQGLPFTMESLRCQEPGVGAGVWAPRLPDHPLSTVPQQGRWPSGYVRAIGIPW